MTSGKDTGKVWHQASRRIQGNFGETKAAKFCIHILRPCQPFMPVPSYAFMQLGLDSVDCLLIWGSWHCLQVDPHTPTSFSLTEPFSSH